MEYRYRLRGCVIVELKAGRKETEVVLGFERRESGETVNAAIAIG